MFKLFKIALAALPLFSTAWPQNLTPVATGLQFPQRTVVTPRNNFLISEGGLPQSNTGRVSLVERSGARRSVLEGLPSGPAHFTNPFGPTGLVIEGKTLYLLIGEGDVMSGTPPNYGINVNGPSSPIFSSILRFDFDVELDEVGGAFRLNGADHWALLDGYDVNLTNATGQRVRVELLTAFRPMTRNVTTTGEGVRPADPYDLVLDSASNSLLVVDASQETVVRVDKRTGKLRVLVRFAPAQRGGLPVDNVPSGICLVDGEILVSFLSAGPFPVGEASIRSVSANSGAVAMRHGGLTALTGIHCTRSSSGVPRIYTSEFTLDLFAPAPSGRVQVIEGENRRVLAESVPFPTSLTTDPETGDLLVLTLIGTLFRLPAR